MKTTADSGGALGITFHVDVSFGAPTAFEATTSFEGPVTMLDTGDARIGDALLLDAVIDAGSRALLERADAEDIDATVEVDGNGLIDVSGDSQPAVTVLLTVTLAESARPPASPPPAVLPDTSIDTSRPPSPVAALLVLAIAWVAIASGARRGGRLGRRARVSSVDEPAGRSG